MNISMIRNILYDSFEEDIFINSSSDNSPEIVMYLRFFVRL